MNSLLTTAIIIFFLGAMYGELRESLARLLRRRRPARRLQPAYEDTATTRRWM